MPHPPVPRRAALLGLAALTSGCRTEPSRNEGGKPRSMTTAATMPSIFLAHGAPPLLDDAAWVAELAAWAKAMPRPKAVLMLSAHWVDQPITLGATTTVPLVYDFYGFPERYYQVKYPAPGAPELASRLRSLLPGTRDLPTRGLDHGAYVPLVAMYPEADVPVLQMSIPTLRSKDLLALGKALAPLRDEGVLIVGSGFLTHNLGMVRMRGGTPDAWAIEFDQWAQESLEKRDADTLADYRVKGPHADVALPTVEHFVPVLVSLGASLDRSEKVSFPITGFAFGSFTKRSVQFG